MKMTKKPFVRLFSMLTAGLLLATAFLSSCSKTDDPAPTTIVDVASANPNFEVLTVALTKANLATTLKGTGPFTVFAPTDAAFITYLGATDKTDAKNKINALSGTDLDNLKNTLQYHVVSGKTLSTGLSNNQSLPTLLNGNSLTVIITGSSIAIRDNNASTADAKVTTPDVACSNGVIHGIDAVLVPTLANIVQIAAANPDFSILVAAVTRAGLANTLSGITPYTVFAPTDAAFISYIKNVLNVSSVTDKASAIAAVNTLPANVLADVLTYHVVSGSVKAADLTAGTNVAVASIRATNKTIYVTKVASPLAVSVNGAKVTTADVAASNGTIHIIDQVLTPPAGDIVALASADPRFTALVAAAAKTDLVGALQGAGPLTVFAPTNDAFAKLSAPYNTVANINNITDANQIAALKNILLYHVVSARAYSTNLTNNQALTTLYGTTPTLAVGVGTGVTVKGNTNSTASNVVIPNLTATNGVVHVIDQVLTP